MKEFKILILYPNMQMITLLPSNISLLSACLKKEGFNVDLFDTTFYRIEEKSVDEKRVDLLQLRAFDLSQYGICYKNSDVFDDFKKKVSDFKPDLIAVTLVQDTFPLALDMITSLGKERPPVIAGGVHVILNPDYVLSNDEIDMICWGEGEEALPELCKKMCNKEPLEEIRNIWLKKGDGVIKNEMRPLVNLNEIPFNDFSLFEKERFYRPMQGKVYRMIPVEIDRGCPYMCTYCSAPSLRKIYQEGTGQKYFRIKNKERIFRELKHQTSLYNADYIFFNTETFLSMNENKFEEFAREYIDKINLPFWCQTRIETIAEDKICWLDKMGCDRLSIGIEHGNEEFRKRVLKKKFTNEQVIRAFEILKRYSIPITVNNIMGIPGETRELAFDTIRLNREIQTDSISCFAFTPYRGTELREIAIQKGYISEDTQTHNVVETTLNMPQFPKEEIEGLMRTFPLYIKMPEERFGEIALAEKFTPEGDAMYKKLAREYQELFW